MSNNKIQIGQKFGSWTVIAFLSKKDACAVGYKGGSAYLCECSCSLKTRRYKASTGLLKGQSLSCGCARGVNNKLNSLRKYGVELAAHRPETVKKRAATNLIRYGVDNPFKNKKLMEKAQLKVDWQARDKKTRETNIKRYGFSCFFSKENPNRLNYKQTKASIAKTLSTKKNIGSINVLPNGMYVTEYCKVYGVPSQHANSIFREMGPEAAQTYIENKETSKDSYLERYFANLMKPELNLDFYNKRVSVGGKVHRPDFVASDDVHINVDGLLWHSDKYKKDNAYHFNKRAAYEVDNKQLLQFRSDEVFGKPNIVKSMVLHKLGITTVRYMARKTLIQDASWQEAKEFLTLNHIMGAGAPGKSIALKVDNKFIAMLTYKVNTDKSIEILRYATALNAHISGGFSKLLKNLLQNNPTAEQVISFVDLRYGTGRSLERCGFIRKKVDIGWQWVDKFSKTQNRLRCRATEDESELTKASKLNWAKIYDAGQAKYVLDLKNDSMKAWVG